MTLKPFKVTSFYRHHTEPRVQLYVPKEESLPIPLKYIDVTRATHTNLDVLQESRIDDYWNFDGSRDLSDSWTGFTQFTQLDEKPPDGYMWSGRRLTKRQATSRPDHLCPELQGVALFGAVALNSADFATVALNSAFFIHLSIHPRYFFFKKKILLREIVFFFSFVGPSTVHNSQHVWLMFDTESQLFLIHGQGFGLDSNDGGSLENGPGSRLDDCGYDQEALLERGLGASVPQCLFIKTLISS